MEEIPNKAYFRSTEVCQMTDTQPYVLRFWESEFPQLRPSKNRSGQKVYSRNAVELILQIKKLLHEDEMSLADAREHLDRERTGGKRARRAPSSGGRGSGKSVAADAEPRGTAPSETKLAELRDRYEAACGEIERLQGEIARAKENERELERLREEADSLRERFLGREKNEEERLAAVHAENDKLRKSLRRSEAARRRMRERSRSVAESLEALVSALARRGKPGS